MGKSQAAVILAMLLAAAFAPSAQAQFSVQAAPAAGGSSAWSSLTAPTGDLSLNMAGHASRFTNGTFSFAGCNTPGSVCFVDGSGNLGQDNANLFWDATNKYLILGDTVDGGVSPLTASSVNHSSLDNSAITGYMTDTDPAANGTLIGIRATAEGKNTSGTMDEIDGGFFAGTLSAAGTVTDLEGIRVSTSKSAGTATNSYGVRVDDITAATNNYAIKTGAGLLVLGDLKNTGAATGKTVVCVDTTTGQLYASTSGVACAN